MLARAEVAAGLDVGIRASLNDRLNLGPIPVMEFSLRLQDIQRGIDRLDAHEFAAKFTPFVEAAKYTLSEARRLKMKSDPLTPERGQIPAFDKHPPFVAEAELAGISAILAFGICSAIAGRSDAMAGLEAALESRFPGPFPGNMLLEYWKGNTTEIADWHQYAADAIKTISRLEYVEPGAFFQAGLHFLFWIKSSLFHDLLMPRLAAWQRGGWVRIAAKEKFRLLMPTRNAPRIEAILNSPGNDQQFVANLLLVASEALAMKLPVNYRNRLTDLAQDIEPDLGR